MVSPGCHIGSRSTPESRKCESRPHSLHPADSEPRWCKGKPGPEGDRSASAIVPASPAGADASRVQSDLFDAAAAAADERSPATTRPSSSVASRSRWRPSMGRCVRDRQHFTRQFDSLREVSRDSVSAVRNRLPKLCPFNPGRPRSGIEITCSAGLRLPTEPPGSCVCRPEEARRIRGAAGRAATVVCHRPPPAVISTQDGNRRRFSSSLVGVCTSSGRAAALKTRSRRWRQCAAVPAARASFVCSIRLRNPVLTQSTAGPLTALRRYGAGLRME